MGRADFPSPVLAEAGGVWFAPVTMTGSSLRHAVAWVLVAASGGWSQAQQAATAPVALPYESIVKIENASVDYDYSTPWNAGNYGGGTGTGFFIGQNRFLTNAHVVSSSRRLMVTLTGDPTPHPARLLFVAHDCDLALFELDDERLSARLQPLPIGTTPRLDSEVRAVGFPVGGERLSVTRGVVSRIDYVGYAHSQVDEHLAVQIDAAINPGNSGGPVLQDGRVVGVAFQGLGEAENTGYMIPPPVIQRFLKDVEDGEYDGYVELGMTELPLVNPAQRAALGLEDDGRGVLVGQVLATGSADGALQTNDILLAMDGLPIASDGTVVLDGERLNMAEVVERRFVGDRVVVDLLRAGQPQQVELTLRTLPALKLLSTDYDHPPRYLVAAGLVFQPVNRNLFGAMQPSPAVSRSLEEYFDDSRFLETPDIVVFTQVLPASVNRGTEEFVGGVVERIDGTPVRTLHDAHRLLNQGFARPEGGEFIEIRLREQARPVLLRRAEAAAAHQQILANYDIRAEARLGDEVRFERSAAAVRAAAGAAANPAPGQPETSANEAANSATDAASPIQRELSPESSGEVSPPLVEPDSPAMPTPDLAPNPDPQPLREPLPDEVEPFDPEPSKDPAEEPMPDQPPAPVAPAPAVVPEPAAPVEPGPEPVPAPAPDEVPVPGQEPAL